MGRRCGLWVLRRLLLRHFGEAVTSVTLISLLLGTNLYHYATFDSSYGTFGFDFASPRIAGVLFSVQKGLFFWSPLLLLRSSPSS